MRRLQAGRAVVVTLGICLFACAAGTLHAATATPATVRRLVLRLPQRGPTAAPDHRAKLDAFVPAEAAVRAFDPRTGDVRVTVGGVVCIDVPAASDGVWSERSAFVFRGRVGKTRARIDTLHGRVRVDARGLDLSALTGDDAAALRVAIRLGTSEFDAAPRMRVRGRRWRLDRSAPPGGPGDPGPGDPPTTDPLAGGVLATFDVYGQRYRIWVTNPVTIADLYLLRQGKITRRIPSGRLLAGQGAGAHNAPWSWHVDPADVQMVDLAIEVCDGTPQIVENDLAGYLNVGRYCPWYATLVSLDDHR